MKNATIALFLLSLFKGTFLISQPLNTYFRDTSIRFEGVVFEFKNLTTGYREAHLTLRVFNTRNEVVTVKSKDILLKTEQSSHQCKGGEILVVAPVSSGIMNLNFPLENKILKSFTITIASIGICKSKKDYQEELRCYTDTSFYSDYFHVSVTDRKQVRTWMRVTLKVANRTDKLLEVNHKNITASLGERKIIRHNKSGERPFYLTSHDSIDSYYLYFPKVPVDSTLVSMRNVFKIYEMIPSVGSQATFKWIPDYSIYQKKDIDKIE